MKTMASLALACLVAGFGCTDALLHQEGHYEGPFATWMKEHGIHIPSEAFQHRLQIFSENSDYIERHNAGNHTYTLGHNKYSHLTYEEFQRMYLGWEMPVREEGAEEVATVRRNLQGSIGLERWGNLPKSIDWVEKNAVTPVKDQGQCGSCYTFSATGAIEGAYAIKTGDLIELSMQQVVDCDHMDHGCNGGEMTNVFEWVEKNGGLCALEDYPYQSGTTQKSGVCKSSNCQVVAGTAPDSWKAVRPRSASMLQRALAKQPVAVAVAASRDWMFYKEGIFSGECEDQLNHGILAVGYGNSLKGGDYWKVKNSWGTGWGEEGYMYLSRDGSSTCGILDDASYPILSDRTTTPTEVDQPVEGSASAHDCGGATAVFKSIVITPPDVHKNDLITLRASGVLNKPTKSGSYTIHVKYAGAELYSHTGNICGNEKVELPLGAGTINLYGFACPAKPGPIYYGLDVVLPSIAPNGDYNIKINGKDQDGTPLICIEAHLNI